MIYCAAVKYHLLPFQSIEDEVIMPCWRHRHVREVLEKHGYVYGKDFEIIEEGFLTDKFQYLGRAAAADHAYECGQLVEDAETDRIDKLMSEDLW